MQVKECLDAYLAFQEEMSIIASRILRGLEMPRDPYANMVRFRRAAVERFSTTGEGESLRACVLAGGGGGLWLRAQHSSSRASTSTVHALRPLQQQPASLQPCPQPRPLDAWRAPLQEIIEHERKRRAQEEFERERLVHRVSDKQDCPLLPYLPVLGKHGKCPRTGVSYARCCGQL